MGPSADWVVRIVTAPMQRRKRQYAPARVLHHPALDALRIELRIDGAIEGIGEVDALDAAPQGGVAFDPKFFVQWPNPASAASGAARSRRLLIGFLLLSVRAPTLL